MSSRLSDFVLRTQTDERLVGLARAGHEPAFAVLVERHRRPLIAYAHRILRDGRSEDVVQESFARAWATLRGGAELQNVRAWLYRVVHNAALDAVRDRARADRELSDALPAGDNVASFVEERLRARHTIAGIAALPGQQRDAVLLTAVEGRSGAEAASLLDVSEGALHQLVHRARSTLRKAATAVTPVPFAMWAAEGKNASLLALLSESGSSAGPALTAAKVCAVMAVTGAVAGGAVQVASDQPRHKSSREAIATGTVGPQGGTVARAPAPVVVSAHLAGSRGDVAAAPARSRTRAGAHEHGDGDTSGASGVQSARYQQGVQGGQSGRDDGDGGGRQGSSLGSAASTALPGADGSQGGDGGGDVRRASRRAASRARARPRSRRPRRPTSSSRSRSTA